MKKVLTKLTQFEDSFLSKFDVSEKYHRETKLENIAYDPKDIPLDWVTIFFKGYPRLKTYDLPSNFSKKMQTPFKDVLEARKSTRNLDCEKKISANIISTLLYYSAGIKEVPNSDWDSSRRFYPSAGARYPLEIYLVIFGNTEIPKGIYHYYLKTNCLELLKKGNLKKEVTNNISTLDWTKGASAAIFISAVFPRNQTKYGDRGYRHIFTENGCLTQNIYLLSNILGLGCCALGGFLDDKANELLGLDGSIESVINVILIGNPKLSRDEGRR